MSLSTFSLLLIFLFVLPHVNSGLMKLTEDMSFNVNSALFMIKNSPMPPIPSDTSPKISIVIPVFNQEKYLSNVLKSIMHQSFKDIEIIFVDDCSTDKSYKMLKDYQKLDKRIRIIKNRKNRGILYNRMYGALRANGDYVTFIDADDMYCNPEILKMAYENCVKHDLDLLQYDYFGGRYDGENGFNTFLLATTSLKEKQNVVITQPEIRNNFFYINKPAEDLISGIVYDKVYSKRLIKRMSEAMGEDCWNTHLIYMEDFIIALTAAREAERFMVLGYGGVWHWYENPVGMTNGVFEIAENRLKNPDNTIKKLGDYLYIWEKSFDVTENDPNAEVLRVKMIVLLASPDNRHIFARTPHFDRIMALCRRFIKWKYASKSNIEFVKKFGRESINYTVDMKSKYWEFYEGEDIEDSSEDKDKKKGGSKKRKKIIDEEDDDL